MVCSGLRPDDVRYFAAIEMVMECMQDAGEAGQLVGITHQH